ncbi:hypothetical protein AAFP30_09940 [Gordonia sp. CPCC 205515]|uniref:hypothetical protein n=1 Tax=Gordonia sp. CPCC 205515 TaxID=3140791 RepID=UPI003AF3FC1E
MRLFRSRRAIAATLLLSAIITLGGCGSSPAPTTPVAPADLLLNPEQLPDGFEPAQLTVADLVGSNRGMIERSVKAQVIPPDCRPTADADLNTQVSQANSAVLAARSDASSLVELVTTVRRDLDADIRATSGGCSTTTTVVGSGNLRGARVVTRYTEIAHPDLGPHASSVQQSLLLRSESTTTLPDGTAGGQIGYAGYAIVTRVGAAPVTVQLTVTGDASLPANPPMPAREPLSVAGFTNVFRDAVSAAAAP